MGEVLPLQPEEEENTWFRSRLIRRRPDVFDDDNDSQEDSPDPTPLAQYTDVHSDDKDDVIARPPLSDLDRLYSEYHPHSVTRRGSDPVRVVTVPTHKEGEMPNFGKSRAPFPCARIL